MPRAVRFFAILRIFFTVIGDVPVPRPRAARRFSSYRFEIRCSGHRVFLRRVLVSVGSLPMRGMFTSMP